ncbi:MAG: hypothetical protein Q9196_007496, partial [Gyalolechia fulgens]
MRASAKVQALTALGVDASSIVFSICMDPRSSALYVHFAEVVADISSTKTKRATKYNMVLVKNYNLVDPHQLPMVRADLGRLLWWGTQDRIGQSDGVRAMIAKWDGSYISTDIEESGESDEPGDDADEEDAEEQNKVVKPLLTLSVSPEVAGLSALSLLNAATVVGG